MNLLLRSAQLNIILRYNASASVQEISRKISRNVVNNSQFSAVNEFLKPNQRQPCLVVNTVNPVLVRCMAKKTNYEKHPKKKSEDDDDEDSDDELHKYADSGDKQKNVVKVRTQSLRLDGIIKSVLGISRNKVDAIFYDSKLRVNGKKVVKKSKSAAAGDEIDVIKGLNPDNRDMLVVSRIEICSVKADAEEEEIAIIAKRYKNLVIENYPGIDAYKSGLDS